MSRLEEFIHKNKAAFDDQEPSAALWKRLEKKMQEVQPQSEESQQPAPAPVVKINWWKWAAAAMIIITAGVLSRPYWKQNASSPSGAPVAAHTEGSAPVRPADGDSNEHTSNDPALAQQEHSLPGENGTKKNQHPENVQGNSEVKEELFHYARLIEIKQKEIATLKNHYPDLFEQFSEDLTALNHSYSALKHKYDEGLNSEQLLSAMIENLKLQTELLNRQLEVTKKLKQQKNETTTYKNI